MRKFRKKTKKEPPATEFKQDWLGALKYALEWRGDSSRMPKTCIWWDDADKQKLLQAKHKINSDLEVYKSQVEFLLQEHPELSNDHDALIRKRYKVYKDKELPERYQARIVESILRITRLLNSKWFYLPTDPVVIAKRERWRKWYLARFTKNKNQLHNEAIQEAL